MENNILQTLPMKNLTSLDVDEEVEVLQKTCTIRRTETGANWNDQE